ncbi:hypothetical protein RSAG8_07763, partial [Rhizoctonia solani AG-8 WAC10335]
MSDYFEDYGELELTEEQSRLLDTDLQIERPLRRGALERGYEEYALEYRNRITKLWMESPTKIKPYEWAALTSHLGLDVLIIAGTGFGKTWSFVLNCLDNPKLLVYIISPLNALANQQAKIFNDANIKAVVVNSTTNYPGLYKWGPEFRPKFSSVGHLRLVLPPTTTFMAATATANEATRKEIKKQLRFGTDSYYINLGNHRPNLSYSVHRLKHAAASVDEILEYFPRKNSIHYITLVFVDSRQLGHTLLHVLQQHLDPKIRHQVELYHSMRGEWDKAVPSCQNASSRLT